MNPFLVEINIGTQQDNICYTHKRALHTACGDGGGGSPVLNSRFIDKEIKFMFQFVVVNAAKCRRKKINKRKIGYMRERERIFFFTLLPHGSSVQHIDMM